MPFIKNNRRLPLSEGAEPEEAGEACFLHYRLMAKEWRINPRWNTAHNIYRKTQSGRAILDPDDLAARDLAWQVFFQLHVMPYELQKREENGDI